MGAQGRQLGVQVASSASSDLPTTLDMFVFQKTKDHFLEVKMESFKQRYFHLLNDFAYIEVSDYSPRGKWVCSQGCCHK